MNKIKETITALTNLDNTNLVRVNRKENMPLSEECFRTAVKCINRTATLATAAYVIANADIWKLIAAFVFGIFFSLIYFGMKD